jgi:hypothetical protein
MTPDLPFWFKKLKDVFPEEYSRLKIKPYFTGLFSDLFGDIYPKLRLLHLENNSLRNYKSIFGGEYRSINAKLYQNKFLNAKEQKLVNTLKKAALKLPVMKGPVWRGVPFTQEFTLDRALNQYKPGSKIIQPGFLSTTHWGDGFAISTGGVRFHIVSKSGRLMRAVEQQLDNVEKYEVLFVPGSEFNVVQTKLISVKNYSDDQAHDELHVLLEQIK